MTSRVIISAACAAFLVACASPKTANQTVRNPMPELWASIRYRIDRLENNHATSAEWTEAADGSKKITSAPQLHATLSALSLDVSEQRQLDKLFRVSARTTHFGFECNYHALVFFDSNDRPLRILKWQ